MDNGSNLKAVMRALARYLLANPSACDTVEGMRRWWFADGHVVTADELEKALNMMEQLGLIEKTVAADGHQRYRRMVSDAQLDAIARQ